MAGKKLDKRERKDILRQRKEKKEREQNLWEQMKDGRQMKRPTTQGVLYAILEKKTGKFVVFKNKIAWTSTGAAKNAFNLHMTEDWRHPCRFDEQSEYEIYAICGEVKQND